MNLQEQILIHDTNQGQLGHFSERVLKVVITSCNC